MDMWQNKVNGAFGICLLVVLFLGFSDSLRNILTGLLGVLIIANSFWGTKIIKPTEELIETVSSPEEKPREPSDLSE